MNGQNDLRSTSDYWDKEFARTDTPFHLIVITSDPGIKNLIKPFGEAIKPHDDMFVWHLDWMKIYKEYLAIEKTIVVWPEECYYLLGWEDGYDTPTELGKYNKYNITLERKVVFDGQDPGSR